MVTVAGTLVERENGSLANILCERCHEKLGRVQLEPPSQDEDPVEWDDKVRGELEVLASEHKTFCPRQ